MIFFNMTVGLNYEHQFILKIVIKTSHIMVYSA